MRLMIVLLGSLAAVSVAWADDPPGKAVYARICAQCHGDDPNNGADGPALVPMDRTVDQVLSIVRQGTGQMDPLPPTKVSDAEVAQVVAWLKTLGH